MEAAVAALSGETVDSFIDSGSTVVDASNVEDFISDMKTKGLWE